MREIILIQHCQSEHHINEMSGGWTDTPLTDLGREQANLIGKKLQKSFNSTDVCLYSSDLKRTLQTAEIVGKHLNLEIHTDQGLREVNTGIAAGHTKKWANAHRNSPPDNFFDLDYREFPQGETWRQFYSRIRACISQILTTEQNKSRIYIVTHGGTLGYLVAWWMRLEDEILATTFFTASPASISILKETDDNRHLLTKFNDTIHLGAITNAP